MTLFWCSLLGWYSMHMELPNDTYADSFQVPASKTLYTISENKAYLEKAITVKNGKICLVYAMLEFIVKRLALPIYLERPSLAIVLGGTSWPVSKHNQQSFGTKGHRIGSPSLNIPNSLLLVDPKH